MNLLSAQNTDSTGMVGFINPNILPVWKEGTNQELVKHIFRSIKYPNEDCISGVTILQAKIDTFGHVIDAKILRSVSKKIDAQLLGIISNYCFEPGYFRDKKVESFINIPIRISLD